jgi:NhaA family Na+:H+ antiporter
VRRLVLDCAGRIASGSAREVAMVENSVSRLVSSIREFLQLEAAGGIVLFAAAILALIASNTPLAPVYDLFLNIPVEVRIGALHIGKPLLLWINDGLMAVFFLLVGLEIKREFREGELSTIGQALLPAIAAVGGMAGPALVYYLCNVGDPLALRGWAIPAATDIAFAVGVMSLLGPRVPIGLKVFLLALAIFDDLGSIIIIAIFYTAELSTLSLLLAAVVLAAMLALNLAGVTRVAPYALLGIVLWVCVLKSGVHATLAGVATALLIPMRDAEGQSPLKHLEHVLHPWVAFMVVPLFGFANAGVSLVGMSLATLTGGVTLGIAAGLFIGKQIGVFGATFVAVKLGFGRLPEGAGWASIYGAAMLAGIGFTMSLFIGTLAWDTADFAAPVRLGVLAGSLVSGLAGYAMLRATMGRSVSPPS